MLYDQFGRLDEGGHGGLGDGLRVGKHEGHSLGLDLVQALPPHDHPEPPPERHHGLQGPAPNHEGQGLEQEGADLAECREIQRLRLGMSLLAVSVPVDATMLEVPLLVFP